MTGTLKLVVALLVVACSSSARAQQTLGELLDAGATILSVAQFRRDIVGRTVHGPMETGMEMRIVYATDGVVQGFAWRPGFVTPIASTAEILGTWTLRDDGSVCTAIELNGPTIRASHPERCRYWIKSGGRYYVADSASDPKAALLARTVGRASANAATERPARSASAVA